MIYSAKTKALAEKITLKAADTLSSLDREMAIMKWGPDFRAIMWGAVADLANNRRIEAEQSTPKER